MKKKGLFSVILGCIMALSVTLASCQAKAPELPPEAAVEAQGVPLGNFEIKTPAVNSTTADVNPRVSWTAERNAEEYLVSVSKDSTFSEIVAEETTWRTYTAISQTLDYSTKYYLRIYAMKEDGSGKDIALSYRSTVFTTIADHDTPVPDATLTKTIHDFEDFEDDYEIGEHFSQHTGGDPLVPTIAVGEGVDGSNAMKLTYTKADKGWSAVMSINNADKKNWSNATGIRMWIDSDGNGGRFTVSIGKRGYQRWSASMTLNATDPTYVSIPFSAFEDAGGGDGVWSSDIVRLWFYFHAATGTTNAEILVDDITIGSDELHSTDTREDIATFPKKEIVVDTPFETFDAAADGGSWTLDYDASTNKDLIKSVANTGNNTGIKVYDPTLGANTYTLKATEYDFEKADLTSVNGFRMRITSGIFNGASDGLKATVTVKIGSEGNYYQLTKNFYTYFDYTNGVYMVCDFASMTLVDGCTGELDKSKIDTLEITATGIQSSITSHQFTFDDMEFYTEEVGSKGTAFTADFTNWTINSAATKTVTDGVATATPNDPTTNKVVQLQYTNSSWVNYQNTYAVKISVTLDNIATWHLRLNNGNGSMRYYFTQTSNGSYDIIVYYSQLENRGTAEIGSMKWATLLIYAETGSSGGSITVSNYELLIG